MSSTVDLVVIVKNETISVDDKNLLEKLGNNNYININEYQGVGYIKSYLESKQIECKIHLLNSNQLDQITSLFDENPFIVGFSLYVDIVNEVLSAAEILKTKYRDVHITLGGPHTSGYATQIIEDNIFVDSVVEGEGEITLFDLYSHLLKNESLSGCKGVTFRETNGSIIRNGPREKIEKLDKLPFPSRDIYEKNHQEYQYITGSRGCLGFCTFCTEASEKKLLPKEQYVRVRSAKNIVDEIEECIKKYKMHSFRFTDATFEDPAEIGRKKAEEVFDEILRRQLKVSMHIFSRSELIDQKNEIYLKKGYDAGLECVYLGIESGNNDDLKVYNKKATLEDSCRALKSISKVGIHATFGFICFNPYSTHKSLLDNADFLYSSGLGHIFYLYQTRLEALPQAPIFAKLQKDGLLTGDTCYKTHFYDYRFQNERISDLFEVIKQAYQKPPIYYMDTLIGMDRVWFKKNGTDKEIESLEPSLRRLDEIKEILNEKNYIVFKSCVEMSQAGESMKSIYEECIANPLDYLHEEYTNLYMKIRIRISKSKIKTYMVK